MGRNTAESLARKGVDAVITYHARAEDARTVVASIKSQGRKAIATDFEAGRLREDADLQRIVAQVTALGRPGVPDDVGPMIASLLWDDNRWVNGQRIEVSGGMFVWEGLVDRPTLDMTERLAAAHRRLLTGSHTNAGTDP